MVRSATAAQDIESWDSIDQRSILGCHFLRIAGVKILGLIDLGVALS